MIDILYVAWNRLRFTQDSFGWLIENTNWSLVDRLFVWDDGSKDGTDEFLEGAILHAKKHLQTEIIFRRTNFRSPVRIMNEYLRDAQSDYFCKIDNDIACPPGWLDALLNTRERHPEVDLLGMEAGRMGIPGRDGSVFDGLYGVEYCSHIGGVGLIRTGLFQEKGPIPVRGQRHGWTEYQHHYQPVRAWIKPDLMCPQLDRIPVEPWSYLSSRYIDKGWQRAWPAMDPKWSLPYWSWFAPEEVAA